MREYKRKRKIKQRVFSKVSIFILIFLLVFLSKATFNVYSKAKESAQNLARVNGALAETKARKENLEKETAKLKTNQGIEEQIRHKFQVAKEGEKVIVVIDEGPAIAPTTTESSLFIKIKDAIMAKIDNEEDEELVEEEEPNTTAASPTDPKENEEPKPKPVKALSEKAKKKVDTATKNINDDINNISNNINTNL
jgi:cell division protein FtsB